MCVCVKKLEIFITFSWKNKNKHFRQNASPKTTNYATDFCSVDLAMCAVTLLAGESISIIIGDWTRKLDRSIKKKIDC